MRTRQPFSACRRLLPVLVLFALSSQAIAQSKVGTTAAQFLGIAIGPRAIAMGSAYAASNEDVTSIYWNPGAIAQANKTEFVFSNSQWLVGTKFRWFGFMLNLDGDNAFGVQLTQLDYGDDEITTVASPEGTGQRWSAKDLAIGITYARRLTDKFSIGGSAKYVTQQVWNESASTFTFDVGLLFVTDFNGMRLGMSMSNFGGDMKLDGQDLLRRVDIDPASSGGNKTLVGSLKTDAWPTPLLFRVGLAMDVLKQDQFKATVAVDALRPSDSQETVSFGGEVGWNDMVFVRGGYKAFFRTGSKPAFAGRDDVEDGLALGAGLKYRVEGVATIEVNYAFSKFGVFGDLNTFALSIGL